MREGGETTTDKEQHGDFCLASRARLLLSAHARTLSHTQYVHVRGKEERKLWRERKRKGE